MASTTSTTTSRRSVRVRRVTGPRLRPAALRARGNGRPLGVQAPTVARSSVGGDALRASEVVTAVPAVRVVVEPRPAAPHAQALARQARPRTHAQGTRVRLTDRGLLAVLVVFGALVVTASAVLVGSFLSVSNAPVQGGPAGAHAVVAQPVDTGR